MQVTKKKISDTEIQLNLIADSEQIKSAKNDTLQTLSKDVRVEGFRPGKAPLSMVEKNVDPTKLQSEFLDRILNRMYADAVEQENLRPVSQPEAKITKFAPFDSLEAEFKVEVVGSVKLPDYKSIKQAKEKVNVTQKEVDDVITQLKQREADKKEVKRAAKEGDQVWIDFKGVDAKTKEPIKGAEGQQHPLILGSDTFIPGFESHIIGMKPGGNKEFTMTFPGDYGVKTLQNREVTFNVTVTQVQSVTEPKLDDAFAAKVGPFESVADLKSDIKKELQSRKQQETDQKYADDLVSKIADKTEIAVPKALVDEQIERLENEQKQNLMHRGQTWQEYLEGEGLTEEEYRKKLRPTAEMRVKAGLVLAEIADAEGIQVGKEELDAQIQALKGQYPDQSMQAELDKPETRRDIASRMMTQKTVDKLKTYASKEE